MAKPLVVTRHQCPYCRRFTRADKQCVEQHMDRCWKNPTNRTCKGCTHFQPAYSLSPDTAYPSPPEVWEVPASCDADIALPHYEQLPVTDCPRWSSLTTQDV